MEGFILNNIAHLSNIKNIVDCFFATLSSKEISFTLYEMSKLNRQQIDYFEGDERNGSNRENVIIFDITDGKDFMDHK